jgi:hypothetical protein
MGFVALHSDPFLAEGLLKETVAGIAQPNGDDDPHEAYHDAHCRGSSPGGSGCMGTQTVSMVVAMPHVRQ